ncbi:hypothetical protein GJW-30_1_00247 [Variibacter gotjawalensis]|uniref:PepSY domain-containing protein n=1 Tax=Variibacter gotjawalensis TaxID=1333996 RepID=A0A0S3PP71_9BRAD|nr:hypothetical protein [Variibacter gotjawalensis]NIK48034.1 hypothetical protein [Variibacter gotjawalensis]RZS49911.1 hypothetical protein EV661_2357 [Variibacter gotjawalensis]BAT57739.1 hypothetical protein GJW-30_1_00247 [Variibacter gotjawalensis]
MKLRVVTLAALASVGAATSAMAQPRWAYDYPSYYGGPYGGPRYDYGERDYYRDRGPSEFEGLRLGEIHGILRSRGLRAMAQPMRRGDRYVVIAQDSYGRSQRVVIDAETGSILRVVAARPNVDDPSVRSPEAGGAPPLPPLNRPQANAAPTHGPEAARPPAATPKAAKPAQPPQQTAKASPDAPPMPRARPGDAPTTGKPNDKPARVILPGGPVPKQDRTAGRSYVPPPAPAAAPAESPVETPPAAAPPPPATTPPPEAAPPAPTEAAPAAPASPGQPDPSIPPAQSF